MEKNVAIAIDGPAAAGKSTVAKLVAKKLSYLYIDTGAMYRSLTYFALRESISLEDQDGLVDLLERLTIDFRPSKEGQSVIVNGEDITEDIRTEEVSNHVSYVAKHERVREIMVKRQQGLAKSSNVVMDGRDIGTHVLPHAPIKFFLIASVEERAKRRYAENIKKGFKTSLNDLKREIEKRDQLDMEREVAPLVKAKDAIEVDTTSMSIEDVIAYMLGVIKEWNKDNNKTTLLDK